MLSEVTLDPQAFEAQLAAAQGLVDAGRPREGATAFSALLATMPTVLPLVQMTANAWRLAGDLVAARRVWLEAHRTLTPIDAATWYALGTGLLESGAPAEARDCLERVVRLLPRDAAALGALAAALRANGDPQRGWALVQKALGLAPKLPALLLTAAQIRHALGDYAGARAWLAKAERVRPDHPPTHLQRAFTSLIEGASKAGWRDFEARGLPSAPPGATLWQSEPLGDESIAVVMEQGLGDLFHFARYVTPLRARTTGRVVVECPASTVALLQASGVDAVPTGELPATKWYVPLLSLPYRLGTGADLLTQTVPYLHTGRPRAVRPTLSKPRIGLVWKGNPAFLSTALRDFDPLLLPALTDTPDLQWVWLQFGEAVTAELGGIETPPLSADWIESARLVDELDAVVSVDTAVAHVAGAMGRPVVVLLPHAPDWRWGARGTTTDWYPTARLIRQRRAGDWAGSIPAVHAALREMVSPANPAY